MRLFGELLPYENAQKMLLENIIPLARTEKLSLDNALGRVLACDVVATHNTPPFDRASMDGYAVRAQDTTEANPGAPVHLDLVETIYAGSLTTQEVLPGRCIQIATGAKIPLGADAVVIVEDTRRDGKAVFVMKPACTGDNIGPLGGDIRQGEILIRAGALIGASLIGVLASQGICQVEVYARPIVAILPTGEEIIPLGGSLKDGQIYDINSHTLAAMARLHGGEPRILPITGDLQDTLEGALGKALEADLVLTSGGTSVGERDLLLDILESRGKVFFRGVKIKPSKPTTFSKIDGKPVLGIPGNPTSCLMAAHLFLVPALRRLARLPELTGCTVTARLTEKVLGDSRVQFLTVKLDRGLAHPVFKTSSAITSMSEAVGYIVVPVGTTMEKDEAVEVTLF